MLQQSEESQRLQALRQALQQNDNILAEELWNSPKALTLAEALEATGKHLLIITSGSQEENRLFHDFAYFTEAPVVDFPAWETLPNEKIAPSPDVVGERYQTLQKLHSAKTPHIVLASLQACLQKLIPAKTFDGMYLAFKVGETLGFDTLIQKLEIMGYQRSHVAADKGEFAVRGGIIDLYPVSSPDPFRIEFWGDEIESLRIYDPIGQKSIRKVERVEVTPAQELELISSSSELQTIVDYLGPNTLIVFDDLLAIEDRYASLSQICGKATPTFCSLEDLIDQLDAFQKIFFAQQPIEELSEIKLLEEKKNVYSASISTTALQFEILSRTFHAQRWRHPFLPIGDMLLLSDEATGQDILPALQNLSEETSLSLLCSSEPEEKTLREKMQQYTLKANVVYQCGYLSAGFGINDTQQLILPYTEITQRFKIRRQKLRSTYHTPPSEFHHLTPGDSVVHMSNGIGRFLGIEKQKNISGVENEYFKLEYADSATLFVPLHQAHMISKYIGTDETTPQLHTLGSSRWKRAREKTEKAILGYANDLLKLYAERSLHGGFSYDPHSDDLDAFYEEFPFAETEDQLAAVASIEEDMISKKPMDRLVCGDVGYGKTEVAMRAAFKAVVDGGKQVAVLVPTTVLAMQHFENFTERMQNFPLNIEVISRFRKPKQVKKALEGLANGTIDIIIGTHRLVSKDVAFKDLGLIIIDEEQRFGVRAKEHLKKIKTGVDCLTLSATPIPRTLYMSLVGARDMSVINTPPQDRQPITTVITEPSEQILKNAILRELSRDGQVYVVHNRVDSIFQFADTIRKYVPHARIVVGHGQMSSEELDTVFHAFKSGEADIFVATTIIENGIDIPNANTILIDRADRFGLADLYQMRGRVGRWNRRAYAYFLVPNRRILPELTRKRMQALAESSGYGGGMKLAMRDLELRGAGDILGVEQSGFVAAVGFHLYCKLLKRTMRALQGQGPAAYVDTKMDIPINAKLPEDYVNAPSLRMEVYQRLGEAVTWEEVDLIWEEVRDRFGAPPEIAEWLYHLSRVRVFASRNGVIQLKIGRSTLYFEKKDSTVKKMTFSMPSSPVEFEEKVNEILISS